MPVGTKATVKGLTPDHLSMIKNDAVLCNTYHLYLKPGDEVVKKMGGLHSFMAWHGPIFTDSGGFQVLSLGQGLLGLGKMANSQYRAKIGRKKLVNVSDGGVEFRSYHDGSKHFFTPEKSIRIQKNLGADIIFAFDECTALSDSYEYTKDSIQRTHRWAQQCLKEFKKNNCAQKNKKQQLWGVVQGGVFKDLREESARVINSYGFDGYGIGGPVGKTKKDIYTLLDWVIPHLDNGKPRHLLGIGGFEEIRESVKRGIDTFDCVSPTRIARNGVLLTRLGKSLNIRSSIYTTDKKRPITGCDCYTCTTVTRSYLSHLFRSHEMLGPILATIHNLHIMESYMSMIREKIRHGHL